MRKSGSNIKFGITWGDPDPRIQRSCQLTDPLMLNLDSSETVSANMLARMWQELVYGALVEVYQIIVLIKAAVVKTATKKITAEKTFLTYNSDCYSSCEC